MIEGNHWPDTEDGFLVVRLTAGEPAHRATFEGVVDSTGLGEVVGIEILDFRAQLGGASVPESRGGVLPRWSYDDEVDGFYVRISGDNATVQRKTIGEASLNDAMELISLAIQRM